MSTTQSRDALQGSGHGPGGGAEPETVTVLVYSDDVTTRERIRLALGRRPAADLPRIDVLECATGHAVVDAVDRGGIDLLILDGEAAPTGGMGISKQLKDEIYNCPPVLLIIGRKDDAWLAAWSRAEGVISHPIDGVALAPVAADLLRRRLAEKTADNTTDASS
jgi:DNA-binding response OmpR family regulator